MTKSFILLVATITTLALSAKSTTALSEFRSVELGDTLRIDVVNNGFDRSPGNRYLFVKTENGFTQYTIHDIHSEWIIDGKVLSLNQKEKYVLVNPDENDAVRISKMNISDQDFARKMETLEQTIQYQLSRSSSGGHSEGNHAEVWIELNGREYTNNAVAMWIPSI